MNAHLCWLFDRTTTTLNFHFRSAGKLFLRNASTSPFFEEKHVVVPGVPFPVCLPQTSPHQDVNRKFFLQDTLLESHFSVLLKYIMSTFAMMPIYNYLARCLFSYKVISLWAEFIPLDSMQSSRSHKTWVFKYVYLMNEKMEG